MQKRNVTSTEHGLTVPSRRFMKHLGRHLEEIALFVVPQPEEDEADSEDNGSNAVHAAKGENSATNSTLSSFDSIRSSVASTHAQYGQGSSEDHANRGICPISTCGKYIGEDLSAHMISHQNERLEKCPVQTCEYHTKCFARRKDRNRHTLTHYKGTMLCEFCPSSGGPAEKSFSRVDVFKRHLASAHGVEQVPPRARRQADPRSLSDTVDDVGTGKCSTCGITFLSAQQFYEHLDDCVLSVIQDQLYNAQGTTDSTGHESYKADENAKELDNSTLQSGGSLTAQSLTNPDSISKAYSDDALTQSVAPSSHLEKLMDPELPTSRTDNEKLLGHAFGNELIS